MRGMVKASRGRQMGPIGMWLLINAVCTWFMTGLIWFVQLVHYPLETYIDSRLAHDFQTQHMRRTTWVVALPMLGEAITTIGLIATPNDAIHPPMTWVGGVLLGLIWTSTYFQLVPAHQRLLHTFTTKNVQQLVRSNWFRTVAWSLRSLLCFFLLWEISHGA